MYEKITSDNVIMFAIKHYDNPQCEGEKEFHDDMKRFKYIKRLLRKYKDTGILKAHIEGGSRGGHKHELCCSELLRRGREQSSCAWVGRGSAQGRREG
mgnify:CR=1 FL=1